MDILASLHLIPEGEQSLCHHRAAVSIVPHKSHSSFIDYTTVRNTGFSQLPRETYIPRSLSHMVQHILTWRPVYLLLKYNAQNIDDVYICLSWNNKLLSSHPFLPPIHSSIHPKSCFHPYLQYEELSHHAWLSLCEFTRNKLIWVIHNSISPRPTLPVWMVYWKFHIALVLQMYFLSSIILLWWVLCQ